MSKNLLLRIVVAGLVMTASAMSGGQEPKSQPGGTTNPGAKQAQPKDIDPLALQVLKAATDRIHNAKAYSFKVAVSRENLGTNGQVITQLNSSEFIVEQPSTMRVNSRTHGRDVQLVYNAGQTTLFTPETKLYASFTTASTIDSALHALEQRDIYLPTANFLQSDPYQSLTKDLIQAYVIGRGEIGGETVHQLAFVEPHAEWQLWVTGGAEPTIRRLQVVDKDAAYHPRITVDFSDWNFNASPDAGLFTLNTAGATKIEIGKGLAKKP
jgi:hypothetical protein